MQFSKMITTELHKSGALSETSASVTFLSATNTHYVEKRVEKQLDQCLEKKKMPRKSITDMD